MRNEEHIFWDGEVRVVGNPKAGYRAHAGGFHVLGSWPSVAKALDMAIVALEVRDEPRLCTGEDINRVRRELAKVD